MVRTCLTTLGGLPQSLQSANTPDILNFFGQIPILPTFPPAIVSETAR